MCSKDVWFNLKGDIIGWTIPVSYNVDIFYRSKAPRDRLKLNYIQWTVLEARHASACWMFPYPMFLPLPFVISGFITMSGGLSLPAHAHTLKYIWFSPCTTIFAVDLLKRRMGKFCCQYLSASLEMLFSCENNQQQRQMRAVVALTSWKRAKSDVATWSIFSLLS
jgi:hypothetical protein